MKHFTLLAAFVCAALFTQAQVIDPSFEAGAGGGAWAEFSLNFGTPLCDLGSCGNCGGPCVAQSGDWYAWFGGANAVEAGTLEQTFNIPSGSAAELTFWFNIASPGAGLAEDAFGMTMDDNELFLATAQDSAMYDGYTLVTVDISAYADGADHDLLIAGGQTTSVATNFLVDSFGMSVDGNEVVGVSEIMNQEVEVYAYPNPAQDVINLQFNRQIQGAAKVTILNLNGQIVSQDLLSDVNNKTFTMDTNSLENGIYLMQVEAEGVSYSQRISVAK
jgi:hypothetical protein